MALAIGDGLATSDELKTVEAGLKAEIEKLGLALRKEIEQLRADVGKEIEHLRADVGKEIEQLRLELRAEIRESQIAVIKWLVPLLIGQTAVLAALLTFFFVIDPGMYLPYFRSDQPLVVAHAWMVIGLIYGIAAYANIEYLREKLKSRKKKR